MPHGAIRIAGIGKHLLGSLRQRRGGWRAAEAAQPVRGCSQHTMANTSFKSSVTAGPLAQVLDRRLQASMARWRASFSVAPQTTGEETSLLGSMAAQRFDCWAPAGRSTTLAPTASDNSTAR